MELITQKMTLGELEFDFPTTTETAMNEAVADLLKSPSAPWRAKEEIPFWRKFFVDGKSETANLLPGQIKHWISTDAIDRDGEIMEPKGADLKYYRKNGMVLWGHDYSQPENVIAKNKWLQTEEHGILSLTEFARHQKASLVYDLYKDQFLNAWSVGFIPVKGKRPKQEGPELNLPEGVFAMDFRQPEYGSLKYTHTKWILLEYSAVAVPANQEALTIAVGKGMKLSSKLMEELHINVKDIIAEAKDKAPSVTKVFDMKKGAHEKEKEQGGGEAKEEAPAQGADGGIVTVQPVLAGEDPHETFVPLADPIVPKSIEAVVEKTGRVLSAKNEKLVRDAITALGGAKTALDDVLAALEPTPDAPKTLEFSLDIIQSLDVKEAVAGIDLASIFD
jgi:hypothetical protein